MLVLGRRLSAVGGLSLLLALALVLRIAFLLLAGVNAPLVGDELAYQQIAENVAAGRGFFQTNNPFFPGQILYAWQAPVYPLSLAALYFFFGPQPLLARLFGIVVSVATVYVTYDLARRVFGNPSSPPFDKGRQGGVAMLAALWVAIYPGLLTNAHLLLSETLFTFLIVLALDLIAVVFSPLTKGGQREVLVLAGAAWGAATLTRGITLYFALPLALWLLIVLARKGGRLPAPTVGIGRALASSFLFLVGMFVVIAPWTLRNYNTFGRIVVLETKGGVNFWLGNSPFTPNDFIRNVWKVGVREPMLAALPSDELARDQAGYALGVDFVEREPLTFVARMPIKFADFWGFERNLVDVADATRRGASGGWNSVAKVGADFLSAVAYIVLILAAIAGFIRAPDEYWKLLLGGFVLYFTLVHMVVFGDARFHLPLIPLLASYASWFIAHRAQVRWDRRRMAFGVALATVFVLVWLHEIVAAVQVLAGRTYSL